MHWNIRLSALVLATCGLAACGGGGNDNSNPAAPAPAPAPGPAPAPAPGPAPSAAPATLGDTVALTASGRLISFNRTSPGTQLSTATISGLTASESLVGIDRRPADGALYALSNAGNIYTLDPLTGVATLKSTLRPVANDDNPFTALSGTSFGMDFNPLNDRLRVVSDTGQNLRVNVDTGAATTDTAINPAGSVITAAAYTNSFVGTTGSQLEVLDVAAGRLFQLNPQNNGTLDAGVPLGVAADASNGFDIDPRTNIGYAALQVNGQVALYTIDLGATSAAATRVGVIAGGEAIRGLALAAVAAPVAIALTSDNRLLSFNPATPNTIASNVAVTGLVAGEVLRGIDVRPADQLLYGVTDGGRLYTIDATTGAATLRATLTADPSDTSAPFTGLNGTITSVDFNPATDRLRVITSNGQNLRVVPESMTVNGTVFTAGQVTTDTSLTNANGTVPSIVAAAHTAGGGLHDLDQTSDQLVQQSPINSGTLTNEGALGIDITGAAGFDIAGGNNGLVLAALRTGTSGPFSLFTISLSSGAATLYNNTSGDASQSLIGGAGGPANIIDLAIRL
ncbi:DUF4394 domain-containing protein [Ramlibacter sp.]|uniref:DUF4394 domain-containing protein n=1 Tax=Ramlibacter sp. TaxID=1917967 RepID=UPI002616BEF9|nr:DUF4394 domain-containing protein [Ramlibacter sp.]MDB5953629.1 polymerase [Ramlibacter sp.]